MSVTTVGVKSLGDMNINTITGTILDETSSPKKLCDAIDAFALLYDRLPAFDRLPILMLGRMIHFAYRKD